MGRDKYVHIFRIIGSGTLVILLVLAIVGMEWITRVETFFSFFLMVVLITVITNDMNRCKNFCWCCLSAAR